MTQKKRYGMSIDIDKCNGCGACMMACAVENNVPPVSETANDRKGITWIRVYKIDNHRDYPERYAVRTRLSAAGGGRGPGNRHRWPDGGALPGLPLLHGGLPVSRALL